MNRQEMLEKVIEVLDDWKELDYEVYHAIFDKEEGEVIDRIKIYENYDNSLCISRTRINNVSISYFKNTKELRIGLLGIGYLYIIERHSSFRIKLKALKNKETITSHKFMK